MITHYAIYYFCLGILLALAKPVLLWVLTLINGYIRNFASCGNNWSDIFQWHRLHIIYMTLLAAMSLTEYLNAASQPQAAFSHSFLSPGKIDILVWWQICVYMNWHSWSLNPHSASASWFHQHGEWKKRDRGLESVETINVKASPSPLLTGCNMAPVFLLKSSLGHQHDP